MTTTLGGKSLTSAQRTNKSCYTMYLKWKQTVDEKPAKEKTLAHYIHACIGGYPRKTKMQPSLLNARIRGAVKYCEENGIAIGDNEVKSAKDLVAKYRDKVAAKTAATDAVPTETNAASKKINTPKN